jgi:hypothetical protein
LLNTVQLQRNHLVPNAVETTALIAAQETTEDVSIARERMKLM